MTIRPALEIQMAHDALVGILAPSPGEPTVRIKENLDHDQLLAMTMAAEVLCWVLLHDHNQPNQFAENLAMLLKELAANGIVLENRGLKPPL